MSFLLKNQKKSSTEKSPHYGVTDPLSTDNSSPQEWENSKTLDSFLRSHDLIESEESSILREEVIGLLNSIIQRWVHSQCRKQNMNEQMVSQYRAEIITFGSYRLGVHNSGGDIDVLCVAPRIISRESFFADLGATLRAHPDVTEFSSVPEAYVPIMKFIFKGIDIDLVYANVAVTMLPQHFNIADDEYLRNTDEKSVLSLNGSRVTDMVLNTVPNIETFKPTLRFMKLWAKKRGVYSNVMGYLGGISWAILTARVCQLHPNAAPIRLIQKFFQLYSQWRWPFPVHLRHPILESPLHMKVWNPASNPRDKQDLMPIITPAYPCINSTHNISPTTSAVIKQEFTRGAQMVLRLAPDAQPHIVESVLKGLVAPHEFFTQYRHFLDITIASASDKDMDKWYGWCESKLRQFIRGLEIARGAGTAAGATPPFTVHPRPGGVPDPDKPSTFHFYFGLDIARNEQGQLVCIDLSTATTAFTTLIEGKDDRKETDTIAIGLLKASQLPAFVFPDEKRPAGWGEKKKRKRKTVASDAAASASASASAAADAGDSKADASPSEAVAAANKPLPASSSNDTTASATSTTSTTSTATDTVVTITSASTSTSAPAPAVSPAGSMPDEDQPAVKRAKVDA